MPRAADIQILGRNHLRKEDKPLKPSKAVSKKARKASRYHNAHRHIPAHSLPYSPPSIAAQQGILQAIRNRFRPREPETKTGTQPE
jgi:hypothetical protein